MSQRYVAVASISGLILIVALLVRRLPWLWTLHGLLTPLHGRRDVLFADWFGPIGISALYYANLGLRETGVTEVSGWSAAS